MAYIITVLFNDTTLLYAKKYLLFQAVVLLDKEGMDCICGIIVLWSIILENANTLQKYLKISLWKVPISLFAHIMVAIHKYTHTHTLSCISSPKRDTLLVTICIIN